jgi:AcrR family transcriptional regulator
MARISAENRREQFIEAAIRVMSQEGLDRATTRRIAEEAAAPQGAFHYLFADKNGLLTEVVGAVTQQVERILRDAVDPSRGLEVAIHDGMRGFWQHVVADDGLQLMQYELTIFCRRTPGFEWLAEWQYNRYTAAAQEVFDAAAAADGVQPEIPLDQLARFVVAMIDGLVIQYEVHQDRNRSAEDLANAVRAATALLGVPSRSLAERAAPDAGRAPS